MFNSELAKTRIKELGVTQAHLARKLNINEGHLSNVINGKTNPSLSLVSRLAKELVVPSNQLWHLDDELFEPYQKDVEEYIENDNKSVEELKKNLEEGVMNAPYTPRRTFADIINDPDAEVVKLTTDECVTLEHLFEHGLIEWAINENLIGLPGIVKLTDIYKKVKE